MRAMPGASPARMGRTAIRPGASGRGLRWRCPGRELDRERRALAGLALDVDRAAVALDDSQADREAETRAADGRLGGEEGIEDPIEVVGGDSDAGVGELDRDVAVDGVGPDGQGPPLLHGVD